MSLVKQLPPLDLKTLLAPLDERQPAGAFDEEDELFQGIDHEMVKLGGLQEQAIDWSFIDEGARRYLSNQCKHFRIAGHLMTVRLRTGSWRGWAEAAGVLAGMVERYWETGYPKPGATGYLNKRRVAAQFLERLGDALPSLDRKGYAEDFYKAGQQALDSLQASAEHARLDVPGLSKLEARLRQHAESNRAPELAERSLELPAKSEALTDAFFAPIQVGSGNERENRRSLLSAAEIINQQDAYDPTGYLLRRFALWSHLTQAPSPRKDNRTELMAVPVDVADGYGKALSTNAIDPALLQRVERSVASSPYWLRGSFLSSGIARKLDMPRVAEAIRQAAERFVTRLPALTTLQFADGRPFVDGETQTWLSGAGQETGAGVAGSGLEYPALRDELRAQLESGGVESMLQNLESLQQRKTDLRHGCHVMAIAAELLASRGLSWLAEGLYARAHGVMDNASARAWEPELYEHLARYAPAVADRKD
ncbi:type VI secretion system protein TssA [Pseudomonas aeruginosa]|uniref:type VI secretion system protein TssA n=1 Tax=Pseudomonas aeruginosa TaxID=287 RepID=UPI00070D1405|nr:type VI secretion system protein TssA [Pseudomonas aeruginosa]NNB82547.1 type VI secretion system protein TssA [Pseudomonas aeruginosa]RUB27037.1 type VI secretion system protein TssA [Pseudomonas aeruginosa]HCD6629176.1 type VI secretion system protein TssA [Pseudomonas aeruginosa]HCD7567389.1 type VI secretion system protein TssA [Pseudomonas aeruginosa]HCZ9130201.1 type VI secretion system protein TssA [Pseudomonas aeruginosa]